MELLLQDAPRALIVQVCAPRIDAASAIRFKDRLRGITAQIRPDNVQRVILDLSRVDFIDSSGLGAIVATMKQMPDGIALDLAGLTPIVDKVFRLTRMDTVFAIHADPAAAIVAHAG